MIAAVLAVHGDADVLEACLRWHLEQGVEQLGLVRHQIREDAAEVLDRYREVIALERTIQTPAYLQHQWLAELREAMGEQLGLGPQDWFIHFDADEFWYGLSQLQEAPKQAVAAKTDLWVNYLPHHPEEFDFSQVSHADTLRAGLVRYPFQAKVAVRAGQGVHTVMGNHALDLPEGRRPDWRTWQSTIGIDHFPLRTLAQMEAKTAQAVGGLQFREGPNDTRCLQWARWVRLQRRCPRGGLSKVFGQTFTRKRNLTVWEKQGRPARPLREEERQRLCHYQSLRGPSSA